MFAGPGLALVAGVLSILSPCVLPLVPIVVGTAAAEHRFGPAALAAGLALSFVCLGLFVATIGFSLGLDAGLFQKASATMLMSIGLLMILPALQARLASAAGPIGHWADGRFGALSKTGLRGQFAVGLLLGAVWSPCAGPTLGAAAVLAAQGRNLGQVAFVMLAFGIGAAAPLLVLGTISREVMVRWRLRLMQTGSGIKALLGVLLILVGAMVVSGSDKAIEARLVAASPGWLTDLTTRF